jgi:hypothetical protein
MHEKTVGIGWLEESTRTSLQQVVSTSYWPTAVIGVADQHTLLVAGKRANGNTVIESWLFKEPRLFQSATGHTYLRSAVIIGTTTVYDGAVQGRDTVRCLLREIGNANKAYAQFYDSKSIYEVDLAGDPTSVPILVAAPSGGTGNVINTPRLNDFFTDAWCANHKTKGYVYVFVNSQSDSIHPLVFIDSDKDGRFDSWQTVTSTAWASDGWGDASNYNF